MKLFKKIRKGFTLIELVVVIAVIAILSAVSVVSYVAITENAKKSADTAAVRQMNTTLKASGILSAKDITELFNALSEEGMDAENYKPLAKDTYFFWDQENNEIVYAKYKDGQYIGIYPESYKDKGKGEHHWFSLSKEIKTVKVAVESSGSYTVDSAEKLYTILTEEAHHPTTITLSQDVDMMGADISFKGVQTFDGGNKTLENVSQLQHESFDNTQKENSNSGLFGEIGIKNSDGTYSPVNTTISNLTIENSVVGSASTKFTGILGGAVRGGSVVTISNVKIKDCTVYGLQKAGILFGYVNNADVRIESTVEITGCKVASLYGEAGKLVGSIGGGTSKLSNKMASYDVKLESLPTDVKMEIKTATGDTIQKGTETAKAVGGYLVHSKADAKNWEYLNISAFSKKNTYAVGAEVYVQNSTTKKYSLYRCSTAVTTAGEFNSANWTLLSANQDSKNMADMNGQRLQSCFRYFNADAIVTIPSGSSFEFKGPSDSAYTKYTASGVKKSVVCEGYSDALTIGALPLTPALMA